MIAALKSVGSLQAFQLRDSVPGKKQASFQHEYLLFVVRLDHFYATASNGLNAAANERSGKRKNSLLLKNSSVKDEEPNKITVYN